MRRGRSVQYTVAVPRVCRVRGGPGGVRHGPHRLLPGPHHLHAPPLPRLRGQGGPGQMNIPGSLTTGMR